MAHFRKPQLDGKLVARGIESQIEVLRDKWGVPHIYANSTADLFFGQGFVAAQDRLYQMEATYSVGAEWDQQPWRDFAGAISRGLGVEASWSEMSPKQFRMDCGDVRFDLQVMEPFMSISSLPAGQIASAFLTLTDTESEALVKQREDAYRRQQPQRELVRVVKNDRVVDRQVERCRDGRGRRPRTRNV